MLNHLRLLIPCILQVAPAARGEFPAFVAHEMGEWGNKLGQTSLVDVDKDGDLDFISGCRGGVVSWWEYRGPSRWVRHEIGRRAQTDVGGCAFDVNGDGWVDQLSGATLYLNTGKPKSERFTRVDGRAMSAHDVSPGDIDISHKAIIKMADKGGAACA